MGTSRWADVNEYLYSVESEASFIKMKELLFSEIWILEHQKYTYRLIHLSTYTYTYTMFITSQKFLEEEHLEKSKKCNV